MPASPATEAALAALRDQAPSVLPPEYIAQLALSNGGEGDLGVEPGWIQLWPAEEVLLMNEGYQVQDWLPGFWGFGSNGGGELFAFDMRRGVPCPIVMVPFIPMDAHEAVQIAPSFAELREYFGKPFI